MSQEIEVNIKHLSQKNFTVKIDPNGNVGDLKGLCEKECGLNVNEIKLVFKGKILKDDEEKLSDLKIENGSAVHLVQNKVQQQGQEQGQQGQQSQAQPQQQQQGFNPFGNGQPQGMDFGNLGNLSGMGVDPNQVSQMMQNPMMRQMAQNLLSNPDQLRQMIQGNPMLSQMAQNNPTLQGLLSNPEQLSQMSSMLFGGQQPQGQQQPFQMPNFNFPPMNLGQQPNFQQPQQPQQPQGNPEQTYKEQLDRLNEMGFTNRQLNLQILQQTYGNVDAAVERLLNMFQGQIK